MPILRQDPDVVMIGEIRDFETVDIAIQASLTGHLVLSTLHTNTAIGAVTRLPGYGVEPFFAVLNPDWRDCPAFGAHLVPHCKESHIADEVECDVLHLDKAQPPTIYHAKGLRQVQSAGLQGRQVFMEIIEIDEKLKTLIHEKRVSKNGKIRSHLRTWYSRRRYS